MGEGLGWEGLHEGHAEMVVLGVGYLVRVVVEEEMEAEEGVLVSQWRMGGWSSSSGEK